MSGEQPTSLRGRVSVRDFINFFQRFRHDLSVSTIPLLPSDDGTNRSIIPELSMVKRKQSRVQRDNARAHVLPPLHINQINDNFPKWETRRAYDLVLKSAPEVPQGTTPPTMMRRDKLRDANMKLAAWYIENHVTILTPQSAVK